MYVVCMYATATIGVKTSIHMVEEDAVKQTSLNCKSLSLSDHMIVQAHKDYVNMIT